MTITCELIDNLLMEGDPESMAAAARHAEGCAPCLEKLAAWNEITETARTMQTSWQSDLLWPRIERALREEQRRGSRPAPAWTRLAAMLLLTIALAGTVWFAIRRHSRDEFDKDILRVTAVDEVERTEKAHIAAIQQLEKAAEPRLDDPASPLMVSYKEKLMLLDDAIAECEANIEQNRQNAHLRRQLLTMYDAKQQTLREVLREGSHVSQ